MICVRITLWTVVIGVLMTEFPKFPFGRIRSTNIFDHERIEHLTQMLHNIENFNAYSRTFG